MERPNHREFHSVTLAPARRRGWLARMGMALASTVVMPLAWAVDLQVTDVSDTGFDPSPVGTVVEYGISVANGATTSASGTVTLFDLPAGTSLDATAPSFCSAAPGPSGGIRVSCVNPITMNAQDGPHDFLLPVNTSGHPVGSMTVRAAIGFAATAPAATTPLDSLPDNHAFYGADTNRANNSLPQTTSLTEATDLALIKTATPEPVIGGGEITYTLRVTNHGPSVATGFTVFDTLDSNTSLVPGSASGANWTFAGANGTYNGSLAVGATATYTFRAKANVGSGTVTNGAVVKTGNGQYPDKQPANDSATVTTQVTTGADLTLTKTAAPIPATAGETITFTLNARNLGPSTASNVRVSDPLPTGFTYLSHITTKGSCTGGAVVECSLADLADGESHTITIQAQIASDVSGKVTNTANISSVNRPGIPGGSNS